MHAESGARARKRRLAIRFVVVLPGSFALHGPADRGARDHEVGEVIVTTVNGAL
jgi:hypothetical protein